VSREIVCSFAALDVIGEALRVDVRRFPFAIQHYSATREDRVRLAETVHRDLGNRGLAHGEEFAPDLVAALHLFARGPWRSRWSVPPVTHNPSRWPRLTTVLASSRCSMVSQSSSSCVSPTPSRAVWWDCCL
jgi:hypothetical protein